MMKELLPIGSVVALNNGATLMIDGYGMKNETDGKIYDYSGVIFPIGLDVTALQLFNKKDVKTVVFMGYQTSKSIKYRKYMDHYIADIKGGMSVEDAKNKLMSALKKGGF